MKWFVIFALVFAFGNCAVTKRDDNDSGEKEGSFHCLMAKTDIPHEQVCDGTDDCNGGEDESIFACAEKNDEFVCWSWDSEPYTIPYSKKCDGNQDCLLNPWNRLNITEDESKYRCHDPETEFVCNEAVAIPLHQKCDGNNDCPALPWMRGGEKTADEDLHACQPEGTFICWADQTYIDENKVCDGVTDCSMGQDELLYNCPEEMLEGKFICWGGEEAIDEKLVCNGNNDCPIMEHNGISSDESAYECAADDEFVCDGKTKIKASKKCDGVNDCPGEDERPIFCESVQVRNQTEYTCHWGGITVTADQMCDGINDCPGSDEDEISCPDEKEDGDNSTNEITRRRIMKERDLDEYLEKRGIHHQFVRRI